MTKAEMLIEYITRDIVAWIMENEGADMLEAMDRFYTSETFQKLEDVETGLYLDSSASVYTLYQGERKAGRLLQNEL